MTEYDFHRATVQFLTKKSQLSISPLLYLDMSYIYVIWWCKMIKMRLNMFFTFRCYYRTEKKSYIPTNARRYTCKYHCYFLLVCGKKIFLHFLWIFNIFLWFQGNNHIRHVIILLLCIDSCILISWPIIALHRATIQFSVTRWCKMIKMRLNMSFTSYMLLSDTIHID